MKILMIAPGNSIHSKRPLDLLLENGCNVIFVDSINPYPEGRDRYLFLSYPGPRGMSYYKILGEKITGRLMFWSVVLQLWLIWMRVRPDVVHVHWVDYRAYHCVMARLRPLVLSVWGTDINQYYLPGADTEKLSTIRKALAKADTVIVDAQIMYSKCAHLAKCEIHTELLHLGVDTRVFRTGYRDAVFEWRRRLAIPPYAKVLFSMRAFDQRYNHHIILDAFAQAQPRFKTNAILIFKTYNQKYYAGSVEYKIHLYRRAEELGIGGSLRWMEEVPFAQLPEIYALADVIINYPSLDTFPVTFMEAAACERPAVTSRLPSYLGTFAEQYFYMVEPENITALADALVKIVNDNDATQRGALIAEARKVVENEYDESVYIKQLLHIYRKLVKN